MFIFIFNVKPGTDMRFVASLVLGGRGGWVGLSVCLFVFVYCSCLCSLLCVCVCIVQVLFCFLNSFIDVDMFVYHFCLR